MDDLKSGLDLSIKALRAICYGRWLFYLYYADTVAKKPAIIRAVGFHCSASYVREHKKYWPKIIIIVAGASNNRLSQGKFKFFKEDILMKLLAILLALLVARSRGSGGMSF